VDDRRSHGHPGQHTVVITSTMARLADWMIDRAIASWSSAQRAPGTPLSLLVNTWMDSAGGALLAALALALPSATACGIAAGDVGVDPCLDLRWPRARQTQTASQPDLNRFSGALLSARWHRVRSATPVRFLGRPWVILWRLLTRTDGQRPV
jgi:hypothetical protein